MSWLDIVHIELRVEKDLILLLWAQKVYFTNLFTSVSVRVSERIPPPDCASWTGHNKKINKKKCYTFHQRVSSLRVPKYFITYIQYTVMRSDEHNCLKPSIDQTSDNEHVHKIQKNGWQEQTWWLFIGRLIVWQVVTVC